MVTHPLVSVCIAVHDAEKFIGDTLRSALDQTYTNLQVVVVDDASTDRTLDVVRSFDDPRIEVHTLDRNRHMCFAFNEALRHARGTYIAHLDADDVWYPEKIARQVEYLGAHPEVGACFTWPDIIDDDGALITDDPRGADAVRTFHVQDRTQAEWVRELFDCGNRLCHPSAMVRADVQRELGEYAYGILQLQDYDLWTRLLARYPLHLITEPLMAYRILRGEGNASTLDDAARNRHDAEMADVAYRFVESLPHDLFAEAFADRLRLQGAHTADEWECEKALVLLEGLFALPGNPALGLRKLHQLARERKFVDLLEQRFGFTLLDLYAAGRVPSYADGPLRSTGVASEIHRLHGELARQDAELVGAHAGLAERDQELVRLHAQVAERDQELVRLHAELAARIQELADAHDLLGARVAHMASLERRLESRVSLMVRRIAGPVRRLARRR